MEPTAGFGRRAAPQAGWTPRPEPATPAPAAGRRVTHWLKPYEPPTPISERVAPDTGKGLPLLTFGIIALLFVIFWQQVAHAFSVQPGLGLTTSTLTAEGADGLNLARDQPWRVLTAPLLHFGLWHIAGNCLSLLFIGWYLERLIGHAWFALVYLLCGLGGEVASLLLTAPDIVAAGASGAIIGLFGTAFVCSFHVEAHERRLVAQWRIMRWSVPSLIPTQGDGTNYMAHAGGAMAGVLVGFLILLLWPENRTRPRLGRAAGALALAGLAASAVAVCLVAAKYPAYKAEAAQLIPEDRISDDDAIDIGRSADFVANYPRDPRAHLYRAYYWNQQGRPNEAIAELRTGLSDPTAFGGIVTGMYQPVMRLLLADELMETGRQAEARQAVGDACDYPFGNPQALQAVTALRDGGVCPWKPHGPD